MSKLAKVAVVTQTQMNAISCNLSNVITLIAAGTPRGNEVISKLLPQNTLTPRLLLIVWYLLGVQTTTWR